MAHTTTRWRIRLSRSLGSVAVCGLVLLLCGRPAQAYSQFTHLELIDLLWPDAIRPLLLEQYPGTSERALTTAHAYAYGGSLIQDIGYYPFGKTLFSDLTHHVRSGDFVVALFRNSRDVNELAFSIGALSHYVGDAIGHAQATDPAVAETFPGLKAKFGSVVTFEDDPTAHVRTEFGFDVAQFTWKRYAPGAYRKHIGFRVARELLYEAFRETYGLHAGGILGPARSALATYRSGVRTILPAFLHAESVLLRGKLPVENPSPAQAQFLSAVALTDYTRYWSSRYADPGIGAHIIAFFIRILPKVGIIKILAVKPPSPLTEDWFLVSVNHAIVRLRDLLSIIIATRGVGLQLENVNLDDGAMPVLGSSRAVDATYAALLSRLARERAPVPESIRREVLEFYQNLAAPPEGSDSSKPWRRIMADLAKLRHPSQ